VVRCNYEEVLIFRLLVDVLKALTRRVLGAALKGVKVSGYTRVVLV
jgi:hypothetical protein